MLGTHLEEEKYFETKKKEEVYDLWSPRSYYKPLL